MNTARDVLVVVVYLFAATVLVRCAQLDGSDDGSTGHASTESGKEKYDDYFSDGSYSPLSDSEIVSSFSNSDPDFIISILQQVVLTVPPDPLHGVSLSFESCPTPKLWTGDYSRDLQVPQEYPTIQEAIDVAVDYQSIIVDPSQTYTENLTIQSKFIDIFSSGNDPVVLKPSDPSQPTILFNCSGGGMIGGFSIQGGTVGVMASKTSLGMTTIVDSHVKDVTSGIVLVDTHFFIVDSVISGTTDGVVLVKATGDVHQNTFNGGKGIALYLDTPYGVTVSDNEFNQEVLGQGAIFVDGGAALIKDNTFVLNYMAFGILSQYRSADTGLGLEALDNVISSAKALGLVVFGGSGNTTQAYLANNTVKDVQHALSDSDYEWLLFSIPSDVNQGTALVSGNGLMVLDADADAINNIAKDNDFIGIAYAASCGTVENNTSQGNFIYDLIAISQEDTDGCILPALINNTYDTGSGKMPEGGGFSVPDQPIKVPPLPPPP